MAGQTVAVVPALAEGRCATSVEQTKRDLRSAGAPTNATGWQDVRDAAQSFINSHPYAGAGTDALKRDVADLNTLCAP